MKSHAVEGTARSVCLWSVKSIYFLAFNYIIMDKVEALVVSGPAKSVTNWWYYSDL